MKLDYTEKGWDLLLSLGLNGNFSVPLEIEQSPLLCISTVLRKAARGGGEDMSVQIAKLIFHELYLRFEY